MERTRRRVLAGGRTAARGDAAQLTGIKRRAVLPAGTRFLSGQQRIRRLTQHVASDDGTTVTGTNLPASVHPGCSQR